MRVIILLVFCSALLTERLMAQSNEVGSKEKMKPFTFWVGRWQGEGSIQMGAGEPKRSSVDETIDSKLDGMLLLIEGIGKSIDPSTSQEQVVHHALAVLSYNPLSGQYKFSSYLKDGRSTDAWLITTGENKFLWGFDTPGRGKTRYAITLDPMQKTWKEIGEFSADGTTWTKFFEMNLKKID